MKWIPVKPLSYSEKWKGYPFINSLALFQTEAGRDAVKDYSHILRTDCDAILTPYLHQARADR